MRDLEIRGAGNILGHEQSGHISAVGFELYVQMLAEAVEDLRAALAGAPRPEGRRLDEEPPAIDLALPALLPESYVPDAAQRLQLYQRMNRAGTPAEVEDVAQELRDRFGPLPEEAMDLLFILEVRALARAAGVRAVFEQGPALVLQFRGAVPDRPGADRAALARRFGPAVRPGPTQVRLDRARLGNRWRTTLTEVLQTFAQPTPTPVPAPV